MLTFFYQLLLHGYALLSLPKFLWQRKGRPLCTWFGKGFPHLPPKKKLRIWVHAVSVGEAKAAHPLIRRLKKAHPDCEIFLSSITATGHAEVKQMAEVDYPAYLPLDLPYVIRPLVRRIQPDLFLLCETDYWLTLLQQLKAIGAKTAVINGKLSAKSTRRYQKLKRFSQALFSQIDHFCLQDETYAKRLTSLGIPSGRLTVTGNLKYESPPKRLDPAELKAFSQKLKLTGPVITIGSTHPGEEELILSALHNPQATLLLVPRHPHRFDSVAQTLKSCGIPFGRYSQPEALTGQERVILIDAMGILTACYQLADLSLVAGSFVPGIGGHNILEPLWCDSPCLFGPYMEDQPGMVSLVQEHQAGLQVTEEELGRAATKILEGSGEPLILAGRRLLASIEGATGRTLECLAQTLERKEGGGVK